MFFMGIDPGITGGIAVVDDNRLYLVQTMPVVTVGKRDQLDEQSIVNLLRGWNAQGLRVCIEHVGAMPGQGVTSMFSFGTGWGIVRGIMSGMGISYSMVRPQAWQKVVLAGMPRGSEYQVASRLWPGTNWLATPKCRKPHGGLVDAALLAEFGRRSYNGGIS